MVAINRKIKVIIIATVLLAVCIFAAVTEIFIPKLLSRPGEGYVDPASGIHITPSGDITGSQVIRRASSVVTEMSTHSLAT